MDKNMQAILDEMVKIKGWIITHAIAGSLMAFALGFIAGKIL